MVTDLGQAISLHTETLERLQAETDCLVQMVEGITTEARELLVAYQELKQQAESVLDLASDKYENAEQLFCGANLLLKKLSRIRAEHIRLSQLAVRQGDESGIMGLRDTRRTLVKLYEEIQLLQEQTGL
jgi:exopolyphosphatase/pppGpp-phosphohydrolase